MSLKLALADPKNMKGSALVVNKNEVYTTLDGVKHGMCINKYDDGSIRSICNYSMDLKDGKLYEYQNSKFVREIEYFKGVMLYVTEYDSNGSINRVTNGIESVNLNTDGSFNVSRTDPRDGGKFIDEYSTSCRLLRSDLRTPKDKLRLSFYFNENRSVKLFIEFNEDGTIKPQSTEQWVSAYEDALSEGLIDHSQKPDTSVIHSVIKNLDNTTSKSTTYNPTPTKETKAADPKSAPNSTEPKLVSGPTESKLETKLMESELEAKLMESKLEAKLMESELEAKLMESKLEAKLMESKLETKLEVKPTEIKSETKLGINPTEFKSAFNPTESKPNEPKLETKTTEAKPNEPKLNTDASFESKKYTSDAERTLQAMRQYISLQEQAKQQYIKAGDKEFINKLIMEKEPKLKAELKKELMEKNKNDPQSYFMIISGFNTY